MDIIELSHKMEANLLESLTKDSLNPPRNENFSPRVTRSQTNKGETSLVKETDVISQEKRNSRKIDEVEKVFLSHKKSKTLHKKLETIYEDPIWKKGNTMLLGTNKIKRSIYLDREFRITSKQKSKLRKIKIKRLGKRLKPFKISDEEFKNRMQRIESYLNENDVEIKCETEHCETKLKNVDHNEGYSDLKKAESHGTKKCENNENESLKLGDRFLFQS